MPDPSAWPKLDLNDKIAEVLSFPTLTGAISVPRWWRGLLVLALLAAGQGLSITALMGVLMVIGIAVWGLASGPSKAVRGQV